MKRKIIGVIGVAICILMPLNIYSNAEQEMLRKEL